MTCYTYMVECSDKSLYTGWTNDLEARIRATMPVKAQNIQRAADR